MGVSLSSLVEPTEIRIEALSGKTVAVDAMNMIYQFATTIRQPDGTPLKDSKGQVTSHLTGLFARCTKLLQKNIKMIFVFDGEMPPLKAQERAYRQEQKDKALKKLRTAIEESNVADMKKYSSQTTKVTSEMIEESKLLLDALGIPYIVAPMEGEAQCGELVRNGDADFVASQDYDALIYGSPQVIRNLSISNKRKKVNALTYTQVLPETLTLQQVLDSLELSITQLRALAMIIGTDFNRGGVKGLGPKKGLKLVKEHKDDLEKLFTEIKFEEHSHASWQDVYKTIAEMPTTKEYTINYKNINKEALIELLVHKHDFSKERVENAVELIEKAKKKGQQSSLSAFIK